MSEDRGRSAERKADVETSNDDVFQSVYWSGKPGNSGIFQQQYGNSIELPTLITNSFTMEQINSYAVIFRLNEINKLFVNNDFIPKDERLRSPSPAPEYDNFGKRRNTREFRYRKKLEDERYTLFEYAIENIPGFQKPEWFKIKPKHYEFKLFIETEKYPQINFIGLLIGPRGNTLKKLQNDSGAKIGIRGKGSIKEGRINSSSQSNEKLHCLITSDSPEKLELAKTLCLDIINKAINSPVGGNDLKRDQLRELAKLNGTFRDNSLIECLKCGNLGHTKNNCPTNKNDSILNSIKCNNCGNIGHLEKDCKIENNQMDEKMDKEFEDFMNELNSDNDEENGNDNDNDDDNEGNKNTDFSNDQSIQQSQPKIPSSQPPSLPQNSSNVTHPSSLPQLSTLPQPPMKRSYSSQYNRDYYNQPLQQQQQHQQQQQPYKKPHYNNDYNNTGYYNNDGNNGYYGNNSGYNNYNSYNHQNYYDNNQYNYNNNSSGYGYHQPSYNQSINPFQRPSSNSESQISSVKPSITQPEIKQKKILHKPPPTPPPPAPVGGKNNSNLTDRKRVSTPQRPPPPPPGPPGR